MNTGLKNKLLILATAAGLAGFGTACSSSEAPAAEEGAPAATTGGEAAPAEAAPAAAPAEGAPAAAPASEQSCSGAKGKEGSCS
jgi:hypothetical protein